MKTREPQGLVETITKGSKSFQKRNAHLLQAPALIPPRGSPQGPIAQRTLRDAALGETQGKGGYSGRVLVRITSYRRHLLDPDNLCAKYFLDCCRYAGILRDDSPEEIELVTRQEKVGSKAEERTEIEIFPITPNPAVGQTELPLTS